MSSKEILDDVDKRILKYLQEDARLTATDLAERVGVSDNTIHNRVDRLEAEGVINGYHANVDHDLVGLPLNVLFTCTADITEREARIEEALDISCIVTITEVMAGEENLLIQALCVDDEDMADVVTELRQIGLQIHDQLLIRSNHTEPIDVSTAED